MIDNRKYFLILDVDREDQITECYCHQTDDQIGYSYGYTYVVPNDLYKRHSIVWYPWQLRKLKYNYYRLGRKAEIDKVLSHKVQILPKQK